MTEDGCKPVSFFLTNNRQLQNLFSPIIGSETTLFSHADEQLAAHEAHGALLYATKYGRTSKNDATAAAAVPNHS